MRRKKRKIKLSDEYFKGQKLRYTREGWLEDHPEDKVIDEENMRARQTGYAYEDVRHMMSAICLRACADYRQALNGLTVYKESAQPYETLAECRDFFGSTMFQYFVNGMDVDEIERQIRSTPDGSIRSLMSKIEKEQRPMVV